MNIRKLARGQECTLRLPEVCNWDSETVVLHHVRRSWNSGIGQKPPDTHGIFVCSACHAYCHGPIQVDGWWVVDAILRTRDILDGNDD